MHYLSNAQFITENASPHPPQEKEKKGGGGGAGWRGSSRLGIIGFQRLTKRTESPRVESNVQNSFMPVTSLNHLPNS